MKLVILHIIILFLFSSVFSRDISIQPVDSLESERLRIWIPQEKKIGSCNVLIKIYDRDSKEIRTLVNELLTFGYYNFYWDKKDDSGRWLDEGEYSYKALYCGRKREGLLTAKYIFGERECIVTQLNESPGEFELDVRSDSINISIEIYKFNGQLLESPIKDSVVSKGDFHFTWKPAGGVFRGRYKMKLYTGDFVETYIVWKKRPTN